MRSRGPASRPLTGGLRRVSLLVPETSAEGLGHLGRGISRPAPAGNGRSDARLAAAQPERRIISTPLPGLTLFGHDAGNRKGNPLKPTAVVKAMVCSGADFRPRSKENLRAHDSEHYGSYFIT